MKKESSNLLVGAGIIIALLYMGSQGWFSFNIYSGGGIPPIIINPPENPDYEPPVASTCSQYNIGLEFRNAFGNVNINNFRTVCQAIPGVWTERNNEISCWFPRTTPVNCDDVNVQLMRNYCVSLKSSWVCDDDLAFVGCLCNKASPGVYPLATTTTIPTTTTFYTTTTMPLPPTTTLGGSFLTEAECSAWKVAMGKTSVKQYSMSMEECADFSWNNCNSMGMTLKYFDWQPNCCIWTCE